LFSAGTLEKTKKSCTTINSKFNYFQFLLINSWNLVKSEKNKNERKK